MGKIYPLKFLQQVHFQWNFRVFSPADRRFFKNHLIITENCPDSFSGGKAGFFIKTMAFLDAKGEF